tara:strand:- start:1999 stop:2718 length:720 start_codon:yes stop_codon:yes gene_type:complete
MKRMVLFSWENLKQHIKTWLYISLIMIIAILIAGFASHFLYSIIVNTIKHVKQEYEYFILVPYFILVAFLLYKILVKLMSYWFFQTYNALNLARGQFIKEFKERIKTPALLQGFILYLLITLILPFLCIDYARHCLAFLQVAMMYKLLLLFVIRIVFTVLMVFLYVRLYFYKFVILDEQDNALKALDKSWKMTKGNFWEIFLIICTNFFFPVFFIINIFIPVQDLPASFLYVRYKNKSL